MKRYFSFVVVLLLIFFNSNIMAQTTTTTISGKVVSFEESTAVEGVSILIKGTNHYTGTQADGTFSIDISPENKVLVFKHDEYETQEIKITDSKVYDIVLKRNTNNSQIVEGDSLSRQRSLSVTPIIVKKIIESYW